MFITTFLMHDSDNTFAGKADQNFGLQRDSCGNSLNFSKLYPNSQARHKWDDSPPQDPGQEPSDCSGSYLFLGSRGSGGVFLTYCVI